MKIEIFSPIFRTLRCQVLEYLEFPSKFLKESKNEKFICDNEWFHLGMKASLWGCKELAILVPNPLGLDLLKQTTSHTKIFFLFTI